MAPQNPNPHEELKSLDRQVEIVNDLAGLKPIFFRLEEIARDHPNDFQVQLAVGDIKQHLVNRSAKIKQMQEAIPGAPPPPPTPPGGPRPPANPTVILPPDSMPTMPMQMGAPPGLPPVVPMPGASPRVPPPPVPQAAPPPKQAAPPPPPAMPKSPGPPPPPMGPGGTGERPPATATTIPPPVKPAAGPPVPPPAPPRTPPPAQPLASPPTVRIPPQATPVKPQGPKGPVGPPPSSSGGGWKKPVMIGGILGILLALGVVGFLVYKRKAAPAGTTTATTTATGTGIAVAVNTTPTGASIRINGETKCNSNCTLTLDPGSYQVTAFLDGYEPAASGVTLTAGAAVPPLNLTLEPQAQSVRVLTDLPQGKVTLDDEPAQDLTDGQFVLDKMKPGTHIVKLASRLGEAQFTVEIADGAAPKVASPVATKNLFGVLVSSIGTKAHVTTSTTPLKLVANGQPESDLAGPEGVDLKNFQGGVLELMAGEGKDQKTVKENFGPAPTLTAFFKSDQNIGTLVVATSEDDSRVFLNGKEYPRHTQKGQLRISTIGPVTVRVMKDGFDPTDQQAAVIKKGAEVRLEFKLKPTVIMSTLMIRGGTPGADVTVDQSRVGAIGPDGTFSTQVASGNHVIEMRRDQFAPKRFERNFSGGQPVTISGADATLASLRPATPEPPKTVRIGGDTPAPKAPVQTARAGTMDDWEMPTMWRQEEGTYIHRGAAWIPYKLPAHGTFTFTVQLQKGGNVFRAGKIRWAVNYVDSKNYALYEIDNKNFWAKVVDNGKTFERTKTPHGFDSKDKSFTIKVDVMPDHLTQSIQRGGQWVVLDTWTEPGRNYSEGKFGFLVQGDDQIGISEFHFQPK